MLVSLEKSRKNYRKKSSYRSSINSVKSGMKFSRRMANAASTSTDYSRPIIIDFSGPRRDGLKRRGREINQTCFQTGIMDVPRWNLFYPRSRAGQLFAPSSHVIWSCDREQGDRTKWNGCNVFLWLNDHWETFFGVGLEYCQFNNRI